jgi:GNAT superfamily N-acetyltransferase
MIKFKPDLINYKEVEIIPEINQVFELDEEKLKWAIDEFQVELNWKDMWSVEDAKQRLKGGWYFNILEIDKKIVGWVWFNILESELCNLYVHKDYRNTGYGEQLIYSITNLVNKKGIDIYSMIDGWNIKSINVFKKCNWEEIK